jgi:HK97 family phage portal protein
MAKKNISSKTKSTDGTVSIRLSETGKIFEMFNLEGSGRPQKPYSQVEWVWICVNKIIDVCGDIQMLLTTAADKLVESGPVYDFLYNRKDMPLSRLISETVGYYALYREVYWIFPTVKDGVAPTSLIVAGPNQCRPEIVDGVVVGYKLATAGGQIVPLFTEDVWPIMNFNPDIKYHGVGPLEAGELSISANHQGTQFNEAVLRNGAKPGTLLVTPVGVKLDDSEKRALKAQFDFEHGGARRAGKTFLATGGLDVKNFGQTMAELQMIDLRKYDASTICTLFGVPTEIVSLNSEAQYAHGPATQRFILYTIAPMLSFIAQHISLGILYNFRFKNHAAVEIKQSKFYCGQQVSLKQKESYRRTKLKALQSNQNLFAYFDIESHPAIQEMQRDKAEKVLKYAERGIPINQIIDSYDLPFDTAKIPWGDEHWISPALVPARWIMDMGPESLISPPLPEGGNEEPAQSPPAEPDKALKELDAADEKDNETRRLRIWNNWTKSWLGIEQEYTEAMRKFFLRQQREILSKLTEALDSIKSIVEKDEPDEVIARVVFDLQKERGKIRAINQIFFDKASELGIRQAAAEAGIVGEALNQFVESAKRNTAIRRALLIQAQKIEGVNTTTQQMLARQLREGLDSGEGLNDLTARVKKVLGFNRTRAQSVARTQTGGAVSSGRHVGMKEAGVEGKTWLDAHDTNVRQTHKDAGKHYAKAIPINEPFVIGGDFLMHPGDPSGSAANIVNCRCVELAAKVGESKAIIFERYEKVKFYSYEDMQIKTAKE